MKTLRQFAIGLVAGLGLCVAAAAATLQIDGFDVEQVPQLTPGTPLVFSLFATPGARATLRIEGAVRELALPEVQRGVYEGTYVIGIGDRITPASGVSAQLRLAQETRSALLDEGLLLEATTMTPPARPAVVAQALPALRVSPAPAIAPACDACGVVETIRAIDAGAAPGPAGAIAGGVIGALLGSQAGHGDGRRLATVLGALGGALAGHQIERRQAQRTVYEVVVRRHDGRTQAERWSTPPPFKIGDRVRLANGAWRSEAPAVL